MGITPCHDGAYWYPHKKLDHLHMKIENTYIESVK